KESLRPPSRRALSRAGLELELLVRAPVEVFLGSLARWRQLGPGRQDRTQSLGPGPVDEHVEGLFRLALGAVELEQRLDGFRYLSGRHARHRFAEARAPRGQCGAEQELVGRRLLVVKFPGATIQPDAGNVVLTARVRAARDLDPHRSEEHTSELQSRFDLVCRLLLEKKKIN